MTAGHPGVIAPPPLLFAGTLAVGLAADRLLLRMPIGLALPSRSIVAVLCLTAASALVAAALIRFRRSGTRPEPWKPSTALVTDGVYAHTRNPMYVGMALAYAGLAVLFDSVLALALLVPLLVVVDVGVIRREERYMADVFGAAYDHYRTGVRRWL